MRYPGGKNGAGVYQKIINLIPPHQRYIEPFLGGGAIMRLKRPAEQNLGMDADLEVVSLWRTMTADEYSTHSTGDTSSPPSPFAMSNDAGSPDLVPSQLTAPLADYSDARASLKTGGQDLRILHGDGIRFLAETRAFYGQETFMYCDPPYLMETRKNGPLYRYEMTREQHIQLLDIIRSLRCLVMISGYWSDLYAAWLHDWHAVSFQAMTRSGTMATEWLWANFPLPPPALHDYRYLGRDFRERERIKRKTQRWQTRLKKMPPLEKYALLQALSLEMPSGSAIASNREEHLSS